MSEKTVYEPWPGAFDDVLGPDDRDLDCPMCKGTGLINPLTDQSLVLCLSTMGCPACDGTGEA